MNFEEMLENSLGSRSKKNRTYSFEEMLELSLSPDTTDFSSRSTSKSSEDTSFEEELEREQLLREQEEKEYEECLLEYEEAEEKKREDEQYEFDRRLAEIHEKYGYTVDAYNDGYTDIERLEEIAEDHDYWDNWA